MKDNHVTDFLVDYLDGKLSGKKEQLVVEHLGQCNSCSKELDDLKKLMTAFEEETLTLPSPALENNFNKMLDQEIEASETPIRNINKSSDDSNAKTFSFLKIAASVALIVGSFFMGKNWQSEDAEREIAALQTETLEMKQTAMFSLMENRSASRRIQGVNYAEEFSSLDPEIVSALIERMTYDDNFNVRLAALEALGRFTDSETVKDALISALKTEKDANLQIQIIQILAEMQEKKAVQPMKQLLENENTEPYVKDHIKSLLPNII